MLTAEEARNVGLAFMRGIYYRGKISINETKLVSGDAFPEYHLEGNIKTSPRSALGRLVSSETPYTFKMRVHALEGSVLNYEVR